jgi:hypothetical protein
MSFLKFNFMASYEEAAEADDHSYDEIYQVVRLDLTYEYFCS